MVIYLFLFFNLSQYKNIFKQRAKCYYLIFFYYMIHRMPKVTYYILGKGVNKMDKFLQGIDTLITSWICVKQEDKILFLTDEKHEKEILQAKEYAEKICPDITLVVLPINRHEKAEKCQELENYLTQYTKIIGATHYSVVSYPFVQKAIQKGVQFLSLPMATGNGQSFFESDVFLMDNEVSLLMANELLQQMNHGKNIRITTPTGTNLYLNKTGRDARHFVGSLALSNQYASSSFEIYVPILENQTTGTVLIDGSMGYLGKVNEPFKLELNQGRIVGVEDTEDGKRFESYLDDFDDDKLSICSELGIGLNVFSKTEGNSYIEDESAYRTFHLGFGQNIALGGALEASAHYDLVFKEPNLYVDGKLLIKEGRIVA